MYICRSAGRPAFLLPAEEGDCAGEAEEVAANCWEGAGNRACNGAGALSRLPAAEVPLPLLPVPLLVLAPVLVLAAALLLWRAASCMRHSWPSLSAVPLHPM